MVDSKLVSLVEKLHEKALQNQLTWEKTSRRDGYQLAFPEYSVVISSFWDRDDEASHYSLSIYNSAGELVDQFDADDLKESIPFPPGAYSVMKDIFENARRTAMGFEKAISDILSALDTVPPA